MEPVWIMSVLQKKKIIDLQTNLVFLIVYWKEKETQGKFYS